MMINSMDTIEPFADTNTNNSNIAGSKGELENP